MCTAECACRASARPSEHVGHLHGLVLGCLHGRVRVAVRDDGLDGRAARRFVRPRLGYSFCTTRMGATHGLVAHGLNFLGMIEPCG